MKFRDEFWFLSNMYPCRVRVNVGGLPRTFTCAESAFQACKDPRAAGMFMKMNGFDAKRAGKTVMLRPDWDEIKLTCMENIVRAKFRQNPELAEKLKATGDMALIEENTWGDRYWGVCNNVGENRLGQILMKVRKELSDGTP